MRLLKFCAVILCLTGIRTGLAAGAAIQFNRDVKPILADHCLSCHGQDEKARKAKLRLDLKEDALKGGKSGKAAIVPGKPAESEIVRRITTADPDDLMPPPDQKNPLTSEQIEVLKKWIASGAEYEAHWAFQPPRQAELPAVTHAGKPLKNPVDAFVLARLDQEKLQPSPEARPEVLLRRVYLDITGIPPTPSETDAFLRDYGQAGERAYEAVVDRLLASPRYAEKWARWWLDAARYADSDGYEKDLPREQWTWRDWVLRALEKDMPYNQFILEQIAGDLLPNATQDQQVATGFLRNGMVNEEGAIIAEQFRLEGMFDRMDVIGKSVLGLSLQCAQCHSHKFDPLSQTEYYQLFSFLNDTCEATSWVYGKDQQDRIASIRSLSRVVQDAMKRRVPDWQKRMEEWEKDASAREVAWTAVDALEQEWVGGLSHPEKQKDKSILTLGFRPTVGELWLTGITRATNLTGLRLEALTHGDLPYNGPGRSYKGTFAVTELQVEAAPLTTVGALTNHAAEIKKGFVKVPLTNAVADIEAADQPIDPKFKRAEDKRRVGPARYLIDGSEETAWSCDLGPGRRNQDAQVVLNFATNGWTASEGTFLRIWLKYRHGGDDGHGRQNNFLGRFRVSLTGAPDPHADPLSLKAREIFRIPLSQRTAAQRDFLFAEWSKTAPELAHLRESIDALWKDYPEGESVLRLAERDPAWHRDTTIFERGNWQKPGRKVQPGVPAFLHPMREPGADRLAFAKWLVDPNSPTTARVAVNRMWQAIFGIGLVETPEDFGLRSAMPVHREVLDWLSVAFMQGTLPYALEARSDSLEPSRGQKPAPWSLKHLLRMIVLSSTYRQDSAVSPDLLERDPKNRLLARGPRFRPDAEVVRDIALSASGLLYEKMGGRSFYPPVPEGLFAINFTKIDWPVASPPERYRRSLYVFRRRSMPDPVMASFDAPNGDASCVRRVRSNTPLAALTSLNEPVFMEAAQALALRTLRASSGSDEERARTAFRLCTGRAPKTAELGAILELLHSREVRIADGWMAARELAAGEGKMPELPAGTNPKQLAAWTIVSRVLLNLDETLTKN